jgi:monomeric sarcosine oxidase
MESGSQTKYLNQSSNVLKSVDVAVLGGGVMGTATAWRLARRGREVLLLEQFELGHDRGSSHGPVRVFRLVYGDPLYVRMAQQALPLWRELEREAGESMLDMTGGIDIGPAERLEPVARALEACGAPYEVVDDPSALWAGVRTAHPALFSPDTGVIAASASLAAMARLARAQGAVIRDRSPARLDAVEDNHVVISFEGERLAARTCVLAAGAWIGDHLRSVGIKPPEFRVTREQIAYYQQMAEFPVVIDRSTAPQFPFALPARFGSPGARVGYHMTGREVSPDQSPSDDPDVVGRETEFVRETLPAAVPEPIGLETCLYTSTRNEDFVIDRVGPLIVASPCSGHGFKFAPFVGEILACLALGEPPPIDIARFRIASAQPL